MPQLSTSLPPLSFMVIHLLTALGTPHCYHLSTAWLYLLQGSIVSMPSKSDLPNRRSQYPHHSFTYPWSAGRLVLGKSLTCDARLGMRLVGIDKRDFDIINVLMRQTISHCLHKVTQDHRAGNNKQTGKQALKFPISPWFPVPPVPDFPRQFLAFSRCPRFFMSMPKTFRLPCAFQGFGTY